MRSLLLISAAIFVFLVVAAYLVGRCFEAPATRRAIMIGTIVLYFVAFVSYFGFIAFIMSGKVN